MTTETTAVNYGNEIIKAGKSEIKAAGVVWHATAGYFLSVGDEFPSDSKEGMVKFGEMLTAATVSLKGCPMNKANKPAFRTWEPTKNPWKYATYVCKAIERHGFDKVFPDGKTLSIGEVKDLAYDAKSETPLQTIVRSFQLIEKKMLEADKTDKKAIEEALANCSAVWGDVTS